MRRAGAILVALLALLLAACSPDAPTTTTTGPSSTAIPRDFTIATTEPVRVVDPAAAVDDPSSFVVYQVFQRLMSVWPGEQILKPDAAEDCLFKTATVYECRLRPDMHFVTGGDLTSSDVRFSILRALRLGVDGSPISALASLDRIETPNPLTVRFLLKWPDTQFGFALASPACSIVNEEIYNPDAVRGTDLLPSGSGPYQLIRFMDSGLFLARNGDYKGPTPAQVTPVVVGYYKDSAAIEDAMNAQTVDYVWRGLNQAAVKRLTAQARQHEGRTSTGYGPVYLTGTRVHLLRWNPASPSRLDAALRTAVAGALQDGRTLDSLLPPDAEGHVAAFSLGGSASMPPLQGNRPRLTLTFNDRAPDEATLARDVRDQLEARAGVSVQLVPNEPGADLRLGDARAWVQTPLGWLQPYTSAPPPGSAQKVAELDERWRGTTDRTTRETALAEIQKQAAADMVVLPVAQDDEVAWLGEGYSLTEPRFGPGYQLALWSIKKG